MKKFISLYGRAAAGKTTQADLLVAKYGFRQFGMGDRLRSEIESGSELGQQIAPYVKSGTLIPDDLMEKVLGNIFVEAKESGLLFDGFPRMAGQAVMMDSALQENGLQLDALFYLKISPEEARRRIMARAALTGREDDLNPEVVSKRLSVFEEECTGVLDFYRQNGKLVEIDGEDSIENILAILSAEIEK